MGNPITALIQDLTRPSAKQLDVIATVAVLGEQIAEIGKGDMRQVEAMLYAQAVTLQSIFSNLTTRALSQNGVAQIQAFLGLAIKAQSQCRNTLEALNEIKFPKSATFVKQANIANQQQVNNCAQSRVGKKAQPANKLIPEDNHASLEPEGTNETGRNDPKLEAVEKIDGTKNSHGQAA